MHASQIKYQVFVSSTYEDLQEERRAVIEQILAMGNIPIGMERFDAANRTQWEVVRQQIAQCDYLVVIIAERYGAVSDCGKSFTRREYELALELGVPVTAFLLSEAARTQWPVARVETARAPQVAEFRELAKKRMCKFWSSSTELANGVRSALDRSIVDDPRPGWVRGDAVLFAGLYGDPEEAKASSKAMKGAVEHDLAKAGYYRRNQTIEIRCTEVDRMLRLALTFESEILPTRHGSVVSHPRIIKPPKGLVLASQPTYYVDGRRIQKGARQNVAGRATDRLEVSYKAIKSAIRRVEDLHLWSSPVLDYTVRFVGAGAFDVEVGEITGAEEPDMLPLFADEDDVKTFKSKGAAFTAQAIRWSIDRTASASSTSTE